MNYASRFFKFDALAGASLDDILNYITTDRYALWVEYINHMCEHPLSFIWGMGYVRPTLYTLSAHNVYVSMLYQFGILGTALFIAVIVRMLLYYKKLHNIKFTKAVIVPIIAFALLFCVEDLILYIY